MKKPFIFLLAVLFIVKSVNVKAQSKGETAALALGAAVVAGAAIAITIDNYKEQLELYGTEYILNQHPELEDFELSILDFEGVKLSDLSNTSLVTFGVIQYDAETKAIKGKMVLMEFLSRGWANQQGIDITKVQFDLISKESWDNLFFTYVKLGAPVKLESKNAIPVFKLLEGSSVNKDVIKLASSETPDAYYERSPIVTTLNYTRLSSIGLDYLSLDPKQQTRKQVIAVPFNHLNGDRYLVKDFSDNYRIVYNENTLGIYLKKVDVLCQLRRATINKIQQFIN